MNDSILNTIKKMLGIENDNTDFDADVIVLINSALMVLRQLGIGPQSGFSIYDDSVNWNDYMDDINLYEPVKQYVYLKVRLIFDPPGNSYVAEQMRLEINELEWRLKTEKEEIEKERKS